MTDPVLEIAEALEGAGVPFAFTGAFALAYWGRPRGSQDLDVAIDVDGRVRLAGLLNSLCDRGLVVDPVRALRDFDEFKVATVYVPLERGSVPVELILAVGPHGHRAVSRAVRQPYKDRQGGIPVVTAEDFVVFKLIFFRDDGRDQADVLEVLRCQPAMDTGYVVRSLSDLYASEDARMVWLRKALAERG